MKLQMNALKKDQILWRILVFFIITEHQKFLNDIVLD